MDSIDIPGAIDSVKGFFVWLAGFAPNSDAVWYSLIGLAVLLIGAWAYRGRKR